MLKTISVGLIGGGGGNGTVTNVATGTGLTGGPITTTGTIALANTAVTAGTYGNASTVAQVTINAQGQATNVVNVAISIANSAVTGLGTMSTQNANAVVITGGSVDNTTVGATTANTGAFTTLTSSGNTRLGGAIGNQTLQVNNLANAVNYISVTPAIAGGIPSITSAGSDASVNFNISAQVNGYVQILNANGIAGRFFGGQNFFNFAGAGSGSQPVIGAVGTTDANVSITITPKGTGIVQTAATLKYAGVISGLSTKTANYTLVATDHTVLGNATTASFSLTLPTSVGATGQVYIVKKVDSTANTVTITTTSSQTIDGSSSKVLSYQYDGFQLQSDGANWMIIGNIFGRNGTVGTF